MERFGSLATASAWMRACGLAAAVVLAGCTSPAEEAQDYFEKGQALLAEGDLVKADLEFRNALQLREDIVGAWYGLAVIAERKQDWKKAFGLLNKVVELDSSHWEAQLKRGQLFLAGSQLDKALEVSERVLALRPDAPESLALRAAVLYKTEDRVRAVPLAEAALAKDPGSVDAAMVLAAASLAGGDVQEAIASIDRALTVNEKSVPLLLLKVQALENSSNPAAAEAVMQQLVAFHPESREFHHALAQYYVNHARIDEAEAVYRRLVADNPAELQAKQDLVMFLQATKGSEAAVAELELLLAASNGNVELQFALARLYQQQGRRGDSNVILNQIVDLQRDSAEGLRAQGLLAHSLLAEGKQHEAEQLADVILRKDARNEQALLIKASLDIADGNYDQAIADLRTILRDTPDSARALLLLGQAHERAKLPELAEDHYFRAFQASNYQPTYAVAYAEFLLNRNKSDRASKVLTTALRAEPGHLATQQLLAQTRIAQADWSGAEAIAEEIRSSGGQSATADRILGVAYAGKEDFEASIAAFRRAYDADPTAVQSMVGLARAHVAAGRSDEAKLFLDSVLQKTPNNGSARLMRAEFHVTDGEIDKAIATLRYMTAAEPANLLAVRALVGLLVREQRIDEAEVVLTQGQRAAPEDAGIQLLQAELYERTGRFEDAISAYEALLKLQPGADVVANNLASVLADYRTDRASLERAHEIARRFERSDVPYFIDTLGWINYRLGNYEQASALLKSAAQKMPEIATFRYHLGMNYIAQADTTAARQELQRALELAADQPFAQIEDARKALQAL